MPCATSVIRKVCACLPGSELRAASPDPGNPRNPGNPPDCFNLWSLPRQIAISTSPNFASKSVTSSSKMQPKSVQNRVCRLLLGRKMVQKSVQNRLSNVLVYVNRAPGSVQNRVYILLLGRSIVQKSAQIVRSGDPATGFAEILGHSRPAIICFFVWLHLIILIFFASWRSLCNMVFRCCPFYNPSFFEYFLGRSGDALGRSGTL